MTYEPDWSVINSMFDSHWMPYAPGLMPQLNEA